MAVCRRQALQRQSCRTRQYGGHMLLSILSIIPTMRSEIWGSSLSGFKTRKQKDSGQRLSTGVCVRVSFGEGSTQRKHNRNISGHFGFELHVPLWCLTASAAVWSFCSPMFWLCDGLWGIFFFFSHIYRLCFTYFALWNLSSQEIQKKITDHQLIVNWSIRSFN